MPRETADPSAAASDGTRSWTFDGTFDDAVNKLDAAFRAAGITVFARIDQSAAAATHGTTLPPMLLLVAGNPSAGTAILAAHPVAGIDLPLKALIWSEPDGRVTITVNRADHLIARHHLDTPLGAPLRNFEQLVETTFGP